MALTDLALALILGVIVPTTGNGSPKPSPAPAASGVPLKTIITVKSSPYCNALGQHFNNAFVPMVGNDRSLDVINTNLLDINEAYSHPDFARRLVKARDQLMKYDGLLLRSLPQIQDQINQLRAAEKMTQDPKAASQAHAAAEQLQTAYVKQKQLAIDLQGLVQSMMTQDYASQDHPLNGGGPELNQIPKDEQDIKVYLRFDGQRDVIGRAEAKAVDIAYDAAVTQCASEK